MGRPAKGTSPGDGLKTPRRLGVVDRIRGETAPGGTEAGESHRNPKYTVMGTKWTRNNLQNCTRSVGKRLSTMCTRPIGCASCSGNVSPNPHLFRFAQT